MSGFVDRVRRFCTTIARNTLNTGAYIVSLGETTYHEGVYDRRRRRWSNWNRVFSARPQQYVRPTTEEEICRAVREATHLRVAGGGHTFNASPLTDQTLLSLDAYNRILEIDREGKRVRVQAGIRLRDMMEHLEANGFDLPTLGSTNAQSVAGLVATDLHGTGRDHGFLSEQILSLRVVNARGEAETFRPRDPTFHAVIGGLGTCGVVTEVEIACAPAYSLEKSIRIVDRAEAETNIEKYLQEHAHLSFYYLAGADTVHARMNVWDETPQAPKPSAARHDMTAELIDMLFSGYLLGLTRTMKKARFLAWMGLTFFKLTMDGRKTVYASSNGFRRKLFYHHDELEYGVPFETYRECLQEILDLLERKKFPCIVEVRFTPDRSQGNLGPGVGRRTCYIELAPSLARDPEEVFPEAEQVFWRYQGQLHLGKWTRATPEKLRAMFGEERIARWREVRLRQDPGGKFDNAFTRGLFGATPTRAGGVES